MEFKAIIMKMVYKNVYEYIKMYTFRENKDKITNECYFVT